MQAHVAAPWVEACHIDTRENDEGLLTDNSVDNGLLLRSDLQRLFISGLLHIDSERGTVHFRQALQADEELLAFYQGIEGGLRPVGAGAACDAREAESNTPHGLNYKNVILPALRR